MKKLKYKIGSSRDSDIVISDEHCPLLVAEINYIKGRWIFKKHSGDKSVWVNGEEVNEAINLDKYDLLKIYNHKIHWSDYLFEGDNQALVPRDFFSYHGRISRANFRALSLVAFGLSICIFFLPGLLVSIGEYLRKKIALPKGVDTTNQIQAIAPYVYTIGYSILAMFIILLAIKRIRDTYHPTWKLLIPFYNLKLLYFDLSKG